MLTERFEMRFSPELVEKIDQWREGLAVPPSRAAAIRYLIETGLVTAQSGGSGATRSSTKKPSAPARARKPAPKAKALSMSKEAQIRALREQDAG